MVAGLNMFLALLRLISSRGTKMAWKNIWPALKYIYDQEYNHCYYDMYNNVKENLEMSQRKQEISWTLQPASNENVRKAISFKQ